MSRKKIYALQADVCKALAHPLRIEVIDILKEGELCFSNILERTGGLKSNLSQHISIMTKSGILKMRKDSRCNYYRLSSAKVGRACTIMHEVMIEKLETQKELLMSI